MRSSGTRDEKDSYHGLSVHIRRRFIHLVNVRKVLENPSQDGGQVCSSNAVLKTSTANIDTRGLLDCNNCNLLSLRAKLEGSLLSLLLKMEHETNNYMDPT